MSIESILIWVLLGAISGWLAGLLLKGRSLGLVGNIAIGIVGSFIGGWLGDKLGISGATVGGLSIASIVTAVLGACVLLLLISLLRKAT